MDEIYIKIIDIIENTAVDTTTLNELEHNKVIYHLQIKVIKGAVIATLTTQLTKKTEQCLMYRVYTSDRTNSFIAFSIGGVMNKYEATLPADWVPVSEQVDEAENEEESDNEEVNNSSSEINDIPSEETNQEEENNVSTDI